MEGDIDGKFVGAIVGTVDGEDVCPISVGNEVGRKDGAGDGGLVVGWNVGRHDGDNGEPVGRKDGRGEGDSVGYDTGYRVRCARELLAKVSYST